MRLDVEGQISICAQALAGLQFSYYYITVFYHYFSVSLGVNARTIGIAVTVQVQVRPYLPQQLLLLVVRGQHAAAAEAAQLQLQVLALRPHQPHLLRGLRLLQVVLLRPGTGQTRLDTQHTTTVGIRSCKS